MLLMLLWESGEKGGDLTGGLIQPPVLILDARTVAEHGCGMKTTC
jgi:hypothetical protein